MNQDVLENDDRPEQMEDGSSSEGRPEAEKSETTTEESVLAELAVANDAVLEATRTYEAAKEALLVARAQRDAARTSEQAWRKSQPTNKAIVGYLQSQNQARQERAAKMAALREVGIETRGLVGSPLDRAIAQRTRVDGAPSRTPKACLPKKAASE